MRGKPRAKFLRAKTYRITPAGAGKTDLFSGSVGFTRDHPRRCGENLTASRDRRAGRGSPPQVRGKPLNSSSCRSRSWITPAGAGKTALTTSASAGAWDHPRRCGENRQDDELREKEIGSPPQVRGKRGCRLHFVCVRGSPPQVRGKQRQRIRTGRLVEDHPRRCGENSDITSQRSYKSGSPPQVRGKQSDVGVALYATRITPAGAGKTKRVIQP